MIEIINCYQSFLFYFLHQIFYFLFICLNLRNNISLLTGDCHIAVYTAYDLLHRHDISFRELERAFPKEMSPFLDNELESRIRIEGLYKKQHDLLVEKVFLYFRFCNFKCQPHNKIMKIIHYLNLSEL